MRSAAVGFHCLECVHDGARSVRQPKLRAGVPVVTYALIAVNAVMFVLQKAVPGVYPELVLWPAGIAGRGEVYRLVTSTFLHDGVMHILFNMWALWVVGPALEQWLGRTRYVGLYALSALGGSVLVYLLTPVNVATLGASGAIFGLFGATLVLSRKLNFDAKWVVGLIVINLVITFAVPGISWQGHVGGLVAGAAVGWAYAYAPRTNRALIQVSFSVAMVLVFAALVWWRTTSLLTGVS